MKTEETVSKVDASQLSDADLVQLAGYHAYLNPEDPKVLEVNGTEVEIIDVKYDTASGLDAFVVKNINNKTNTDFSIVYVGSQQLKEDWTITNPQLLSDLDGLAQIKKARAYFEHVENMLGTVSSVTGNSFAGALANAIAVQHPKVRSVTLNPAILPAGMSDPNNAYTNITNYYSKYDFLTSTQETLGLGDRVPGNKYHINSGLPTYSMFSTNHMGYVDRNDGEYKVPIGLKGEAGYGFIHVGADDHIITSLWTGVPLYGGPSTKLKMNQQRMFMLAIGLEGKVIERIKLAGGYVTNANEIVIDEHDQFHRRVSDLQEKFQDIFDSLTGGDAMLQGIARTGSITKTVMDQLHGLLHVAEEKARILDGLLDSKPMERIEHIASVDMSVASLFSPARQYLNEAKDDVEQFMLSIQSVIDKDIPNLFAGGIDVYVDAVAGELEDHYAILYRNMDRILKQLTHFKGQVEGIAPVFGQKDASISDANPDKSKIDRETENVQHTAIVSLESSPYLKQRMKVKKLQVDDACEKMNTVVAVGLRPVLTKIKGVLTLLDGALETILSSMQSALHITLYRNSAGAFSDEEEEVRAAVREVEKPILDMQSTVVKLQKGIARLIVRLPEMVDNFKPYIDTAVFEPCDYSNVRLYNIACSSILDETELLFTDITFQLSDEQAEAIQASLKIAQNIKGNIKVLSEQVERGTL